MITRAIPYAVLLLATLAILIGVTIPVLAWSFEVGSEPYAVPDQPKAKPKPQVRGFIQRVPAPKPDTRCKPVISAIGDSARSEAAAKLEAQKAVKARIQWDHGNKFLSLEHGQDMDYQCGPSSVPRFGGTVEATASRFLPLESYTCTIFIRPCEAPVTRETGK